MTDQIAGPKNAAPENADVDADVMFLQSQGFVKTAIADRGHLLDIEVNLGTQSFLCM